MANFGQTLAFVRHRSKITQQELADALGIAKSTVGMYETGKREPDFETLEAIADFFNVDMNFLTGCEAKEKPTTVTDDGQSARDSKLLEAIKQLPPDARRMIEAAVYTAQKEIKQD